jgi:ribonuclease-3 family protein
MGDAIYEVYVRRYCLESGRTAADKLHRYSIRYVNAGAQAKVMRVVLDSLSSEDQLLVKRARNRKPKTVPKNADPVDYRLATAMEALMGHYYLADRTEELDAFVKRAIEIIEEK